MPRWALILLFLAAVICTGVGTDLTGVFAHYGAASFGWTAYAPLSRTAPFSFTPINTTWLLWAPRLGVAMVALGAGAAAGSITALLLRRRRRDSGASAQAN